MKGGLKRGYEKERKMFKKRCFRDLSVSIFFYYPSGDCLGGVRGARGIISLYNSAPDGYTIGVGMATEIITQILEKQAYDCNKFVYLGRVQSSPSFWFVKADAPLYSLKDFKNFGKLIRQSTFSLTAPATVSGMIMADREGFPLAVVGGYQSAAASILALIRGKSELSASAPSVAMQFKRSGQIRPVLALYQKRSQDFPDTPTVGEVGHPDLAILAGDYWFMAPPGVPKVRAQSLEDALRKTVKDAEFLKWAKGAGVDLDPLTGEETRQMVFKLFGLLDQYKKIIEKHLKQ